MKLSLVIPCYNEENNVLDFFRETEKVFSGCGFSYEYVFVNDGSKDNTLVNLKKLFNENPDSNIQIVDFSRNFGKESAIYGGLKEARGELTCLIDADLQQRPEVVLQMLSILEQEEETDCVTAFQAKRKESVVSSYFKKSFYKLINKISETEFVDGASDFRLFRSNVKEAVLNMTEYFRFSKGLFSWVGFNTKYIPYEARQRNDGSSKWSFTKLFKYAVEGIVSFSTSPLKLATYTGLASSAVAFLYALYVFIKRIFFGDPVQGYATIVILILLIGGLQLICTGVIGEYLAKVFVQGKHRPINIVRKVYKKEERGNTK